MSRAQKIINSPLQADMARGQDYLKFRVKCSKENLTCIYLTSKLLFFCLIELYYTENQHCFLEK